MRWRIPTKLFASTSLTNEILNVSPVASHRERVYQVMGGQLLEQLVEFGPVERRRAQSAGRSGPETEAETGDARGSPVFRISGFVSRPEVQKLNRNQIYFFVNRRLVRDRLILHAITRLTATSCPRASFPWR